MNDRIRKGLHEAIRHLLAEPDSFRQVKLARGLINQLRFGFKLTHRQVLDLFAEAGVDAGTAEELFYRIDNNEDAYC